MKTTEIEAKVLAIVDRIKLKQPIEADHVELKAEFIDGKKAARLIAASCNAARGEPVLYLFGVDEKQGLVGVADDELSNWWSKVRAEFDRVVPAMRSVLVHCDDKTVMALHFETSQAPYVARNPAYGKQEGGPVEWEVPWREGNSTRSARREDLLRILVPAVRVPELELRGAHLVAFRFNGEWMSKLVVQVYATPKSDAVIVGHRCITTLDPAHLTPMERSGYHVEFDGKGTSGKDITLQGPGQFSFAVSGPMDGIGPHLPQEVRFTVEFSIIDAATRPSVTGRVIAYERKAERVEYLLQR